MKNTRSCLRLALLMWCIVCASAAPSYSQLMPWKSGRKCGFTDKNGTVVIAPKFDAVKAFRNGHWLTKSGGKFGLVSKSGKELIPPRYDSVRLTPIDFAVVELRTKSGAKFGVVSPQGVEVVAPEYDRVEILLNNRIKAMKERQPLYFTLEGKPD